MADLTEIDHLASARMFLKTSLENSRAISSALDKTGQRLEKINQTLPSLMGSAAPLSTFSAIKDQIDHGIGPAMAVIKVYNAIQELERSILLYNPGSDLSAYLLLVKKLEQGLKFLASNCGLAIQWLEGILQFLEDNMVSNDFYALKVSMCLNLLQKLQGSEEQAKLSGGILCAAFCKLEIEFKQLLAENSSPAAFPFFVGKQACIASSPLPVAVLKKLQAIIGTLNASNRLEKCVSVFVQVRSMNARKSLEALDLNYLEKSVTELDDVQEIESFINQWCNHLESAVKNIYEVEYKLCNEVFQEIESDIWMGCFSKIAKQSGILSFLRFGARVAECKKDPVKLLKLLDMFECLENLRADFNRLFKGEDSAEIQNLTRDLIRKIVCGASEIFWEFPFQVKHERGSSSPSDGGVPRLVSFVTDYCNLLLGEDYKPLLIKILTIHQSWKNEEYKETLITNQIHCIIKEIGLNLDTWSKGYDDLSLSYLFMMNNHFHFCNLRGTEVGELMGESWVRGHEQYKDYFMTLYLGETWGKIVSLLSQDQEDSDSPASVSVKKRRLKEFNEALDEMYEKQSKWVVPSEKLRLKICRVAVQAFVPVYKSFLQSLSITEQQEVKYTAQGLESMLSSLFQPKLRMYSTNNKQTHWIDEVKNIEKNHFHQFTLMAV
ncbi:exocyst complex component EXO70I [Manihot esculenta]|uniref:Exocyst subunit Exo70 family protein n=1 Tax=Manihot esculenta TaxID=3983 RepID=A0A2C9U8T1_MANES|nr:exocyst complex component EXO70I [Manihot esculenta]OAY26411.1 hypothetical protein MANES_16G045500v8 [Manihot esculenta]